MRVEIAPSFVSDRECSQLNAWAEMVVERGWMSPSVMLTPSSIATQRMSTRETGQKIAYPELIHAILDRIRAAVGFGDAEVVTHQGQDGLFVNYTKPGPGGHLMLHCDGRPPNGRSILRCNFLTQVPEEGGVLHLRGRPLKLGRGDLHCYLATEYEHFFDDVGGGVPRIMWVFGVCVDAQDWENGKIEFRA